MSPLQTKAPQPLPVEVPATPVLSKMDKATASPTAKGLPFGAEATNGNGKDIELPEAAATPTSDLQTALPPSLGSKEKGNVEVDKDELGTGSKKKARRTLKKKAPSAPPTSFDPPPVMNIEVSRNGNNMDSSVKKGKGWRQTPLLQPSPQPNSPANKSESKKQTRRQRGQEQEMQQNGWATEDATDVQDMGDFDFEASNMLFDKKGVFDQLKQGDTTADEDRLVSHNKVTRPGTYGGKNLHPTENVLSPKLAPKYSSNEVDSTSDADTELNPANGRSSSKHSSSRVSIPRKPTSRQSSTLVDGKPHNLATSMSSDRGGLGRSVTSLASRTGRALPSTINASPRPDRMQSPLSTMSASTKTRAPASDVYVFPDRQRSSFVKDHSLTVSSGRAPQSPHFIVQQTLSTCPVLHPSALHTLETETVSRFGLTHDAITESAARCVAEVAMSMFEPFGGSRRGSRATTLRGSMTSSMLLDRSQPPVIVVLAGNNTIGARAVAAARHLIARHCKIIVAEPSLDSSEVSF